MPYTAPPAKADISATPSPSNAVAKAGIGTLWDWLTALFGTGGKPEHVYAAMKLLDPKALTNLAPSFGVAASALTITLKAKDASALSEDNPGFVAQRHATIGNGDFNLRKVAANISLVVSSGSTLGHASGVLRPIYIYLLDFNGVQELAVSGSYQGESGIRTTTAEGGAGAADSATVLYSTTARANVPVRLIAIAWSNQAAAGTWAAVPAEVTLPPFDLREVGEEVTYMGGVVTYGFYLQDGANVSRTGDPAKLFGAIGTTHGVGDGATTFGLPDSRRRTAVGSGGTGTGTLGNAVGNTGGAETHTLTQAETPLKSHTHPVTQGNAVGSGSVAVSGNVFTSTATSAASDATASAHDILQPSMVVTKMIRWKGDIA